MERELLIKRIKQLLVVHCDSLKVDGSGNLQDSAVLSEYFFRDLLNCAYGWQLVDANDSVVNTPGYDLVDGGRKIFVQVSKDASRGKIKKSLDKIDLPKYAGYSVKFMFLVAKAPKYQPMKDNDVPEGLAFDMGSDIIDVSRLVKQLQSLQVDDLKHAAGIVEKELGVASVNLEKVPSALAEVVKTLLTKGHLEEQPWKDPVPFEIIAKIRANSLGELESHIQEVSAYTPYLETIYQVYDESGTNGRLAMLNMLNGEYVKAHLASQNPYETFFALEDALERQISDDGDIARIDDATRLLCIDIVLVDAFMRCRIYKGPDILMQPAKKSGVDHDPR